MLCMISSTGRRNDYSFLDGIDCKVYTYTCILPPTGSRSFPITDVFIDLNSMDELYNLLFIMKEAGVESLRESTPKLIFKLCEPYDVEAYYMDPDWDMLEEYKALRREVKLMVDLYEGYIE